MSSIPLDVILEADDRGFSTTVRGAGKEIGGFRKELDGASDAGRKQEGVAGSLNKAWSGLSRGASALSNVVFSLGGAIAGIGVVALTKSFIDAASTSEQLKVRLNALLGSVSEGTRLFDDMAQFASKVPFEYEAIMESATQLAGVMKGGVDEINQWMPMIGDLAAVSGLTIQQTTEQISRMYSAGAASADMFREKGILSMLGFEAGVSYSAEETRKKLLEIYDEAAWKGATEDLAATWEGTMSMMSDKWFQFKNVIMDAGLFDFFKAVAQAIDEEMGQALESSKDKAEQWVDAILDGIELILVPIGWVADGFQGLEIIWQGLKIVWLEWQQLVLSGLQHIQQKLLEWATSWNSTFGQINDAMKIDLGPLTSSMADYGQQMTVLKGETEQAKNELHALAMEKLPSEKMEEFVQKTRSAAVEMREARKAQDELTVATGKGTQALVDQGNEAGKLTKKQLEELKKRGEALEQSLLTETEAVDRAYQEQLELLKQLEDKKIDVGMSYVELRERIELDHQQRLAAIAEKEQQESLKAQEKAWEETQERVHNVAVDVAGLISDDWKLTSDEISEYFESSFQNMLARLLEYFIEWFLVQMVNSVAGLNLPLPSFSMGGVPGGSSVSSGVTSAVGDVAGSAAVGVADTAASIPGVGGSLNAAVGTTAAAVAGADSLLAANAAFNTMSATTTAWGAQTAFVPGLTWGAEATTAGAVAGETAGAAAASSMTATMGSVLSTAAAWAPVAVVGVMLAETLFTPNSAEQFRNEWDNLLDTVGLEGLVNEALNAEPIGLNLEGAETQLYELGNVAGQTMVFIEGSFDEVSAVAAAMGETLFQTREEVDALGGSFVAVAQNAQVAGEQVNLLTQMTLQMATDFGDQVLDTTTTWAELFSLAVAEGSVSMAELSAIADKELGDVEAQAQAVAIVIKDGIVTAAEAAALGVSINTDMMAADFMEMVTHVEQNMGDSASAIGIYFSGMTQEVERYLNEMGDEAEVVVDQIIAAMQRMEDFSALAAKAMADGIVTSAEASALGVDIAVDMMSDDFQRLIDEANAAADAIASIPSAPSSSGTTTATASVPQYGHGGYVTRPHLAVVGDTPEFIIPAPFGKVPVEVRGGVGGDDGGSAAAVRDMHQALIDIESGRGERDQRAQALLRRMADALERMDAPGFSAMGGRA